MFELLFNYPIALWQDATLVFDSDWPLTALWVSLCVCILLIVFSVWRRSLRFSRRLLIIGLQSLAAVILLVMAWRPALLVSVSERFENTVAWVMDNSDSMDRHDVVAGSAGTAGYSRIAAALKAAETTALDDSSNFVASFYSVGNELASVSDIAALQDSALTPRSDLASGLETLLGTVNEKALAAVVLLSDGADNSGKITPEWWQRLEAAGVPVHTVGVGRAVDLDDLELEDVVLPTHVLPEAQIRARLQVRHGRGGLARVRVQAAGELLAAEDIQLPSGTEQSVHIVQFSSGSKGVRQLEFTVERMSGEIAGENVADTIPENNRQPRIIQVADSPRRILYVEGEPRWEYKFLRRAMEQHPGIQIVSLLRTSPNKFYRQGVENASELAGGFPETREQLFQYDAIIIGSFEAAELNISQQTALRDFVSQRGGSLLMLAGRQGLADGGWGRSVVAGALPVVLNNRLSSKTFERDRTSVIPALAGIRAPWLQLADDDSANLQAWSSLPALADMQSVGQPKPGAVTYLERSSNVAGLERIQPLLVMQRYGRGRSAVLGTSGTWRWQMSLPSDDQRHERFWRQLLGMLVEPSVPRIAIDMETLVVRDAQSVTLAVMAYNADYTPLQQSLLPVTLTGPDGAVSTIELSADIQHPGRYSGAAPIASDGPYSIAATSPLEGESPSTSPASAEQWWVSESGNAEQFGAQLQTGFLQRVADVTGGTYLPLADIDQLGAILSQENAALKRENRLPLWNMPFFFLCLFLLKGVEWMLRLRWKRL